jgi:hypothetical protein
VSAKSFDFRPETSFCTAAQQVGRKRHIQHNTQTAEFFSHGMYAEEQVFVLWRELPCGDAVKGSRTRLPPGALDIEVEQMGIRDVAMQLHHHCSADPTLMEVI